jgi:hypothetical protein
MMKKYSYLPGLLLALAAVARTFIVQRWDATGVALAAVGAAIMATSLVVNRREVREWFADPRGVFAVNTGMSLVVLFLILVLANVAAWFRPSSVDLTAAGRNTLTPGTRTFLATVAKDVTLREFGRTRDPRVEQLLGSFVSANRHITMSFVDADRMPGEARKYQIRRPGTILVMAGEKYRQVETPTEPALVTALLQVLSDKRPSVCFTTGNGEHGLTDAGSTGLSRLVDLLRVSNFDVELANLLSADVPRGCAAVIVAGRQRELEATEFERLTDYATAGGRVAILIDPSPAVSLAEWLLPWGIIADSQGVVVDESGAAQSIGGGPETPLAMSYGDHAVTHAFDLATMYDGVRPLGIGPPERGGEPIALALSGPRSYERSARSSAPKAALRQGPLAIAVATSAGVQAGPPARRSDEVRILAFGDSDFVTNAMIGRQGNRELVLRVVSWLVGEEEARIVNVGDRQNRRVELTQSAAGWLYLINMLLLPLLPLLAGIVVFIRSRR